MQHDQTVADWYYVGHYGQLGPLTFEQVSELTRDGVISADTYVWKAGMGDWRMARDTLELRSVLQISPPEYSPPPAPVPGMPAVRPVNARAPLAPTHPSSVSTSAQWSYLQTSVPKSEKSRTVAGLLNLIPGIGRFYLGYAAHGALQLFTAMFCGIGFVWSVIDGIYILAGGVKYDGYGRAMQD